MRRSTFLALVAPTVWAQTLVAQEVGPGPRVAHAAAYHEGLEMVVVFGGRRPDGAELNDLWGWDGSRWQALDTGSEGPSPRARHPMAYDPARDRLVVQGGGTVERDLDDTWVWTRQGWSRLGGGSPGPKSHHQMAYDSGSRTLLLYGGGRDGEGFGSDLWTLDDSGWSLLDERLEPGRVLAGMARAPDGVLLFGGLISGGPRARELWKWQDGRWTFLARDGPPGLTHPGLTWDGSRERLVLFGGEGQDGLRGETWIWDGSAWLLEEVEAAPLPRTEHTLVYDQSRERTVLFGGRTEDGATAELWEWDGTTWTRIR